MRIHPTPGRDYSDDAQTAASDSATANSDLISAYKKSTKAPSGTIKVGKVRYNLNNKRLYLNGEPLTSDEEAEIAAACREFYNKR